MTDPTSTHSDSGYGFLEEGMAVEEDHMGEGALRFTVVGMLLLVIVIAATIQWTRLEGQLAAENNAVYEPSAILRQANADAAAKLNRYGVNSSDPDRFQIPIERAMAIIVAEQSNNERP